MARACLCSLFRRCSAFCGQTGKESPLFVHPETIVSCLLGRSRLFLRYPPQRLWRTSPLQAVFTQPTPVLSLGSDLRTRISAPSPHLLWRVSRQASRAGECWSAPILCAGISPLCPLHPCCCALLRGSEASPLRHPPSLPVKGFPSVWKLFLLHNSFLEVQAPSLFFCLFFLFSFALPRYLAIFLSFGKSVSIQWVFC